MLDTLGSGSQASVYRVSDDRTGDVRALKELHQHRARDPYSVERFRREAEVASRLDHPNVVRIFEVGQSGDSHFIVMEYLPLTLHDLLAANRPLPGDRAVDITRQISLALEAAWKQNVVHRDIKPRNILIGVDGQVKVTDFGIARAADLPGLTQPGGVVGTHQYMAPEQSQGEAVDVRSDLYSLGILLYQMLSGTRPFDGLTPDEMLERQLDSERPIAKNLPIDVPPGVVAAVGRLLASVPIDRYQAPSEVLAALDDLGLEAPQAPVVPVLGDYALLEEIGSGSQALVHRAVDLRNSREVALKVPHAHVVGSASDVERFLRESELAAQLDHPNIASVHEFGQSDGRYFVAMEYLPDSLRSLIDEEGLMEEAQCLRIALDVSKALEEAHRKAIVHRDIKPENILIGADGTAKVADFGIARVTSLPRGTLTSDAAGTTRYMAPEQLKGERADIRADLYALGIVLFEMLIGTHPSDAGTPSSPDAGDDAQSLLRMHRPNVSQATERLVTKAVAGDLVDRFQAPQEMRQVLEHTLREVSPVEEATAVDEPRYGWARIPRWAGAAIVVAALAVAVGSVVLLLTSRGTALAFEIEEPINPDSTTEATVSTPDGGSFTVQLPPGTGQGASTIKIFTSEEAAAPISTRSLVVALVIEVELVTDEGEAVDSPVFDRPVSIKATYTEQLLQRSGGDPDRLILTWFNEDTGQWEVLPTSVDPIARTLEASVDHFSLFGIGWRTSDVPPPVAGFIVDDASGAAPLTVAFTDVSTGSPGTWLWDFGDGTSSTERNPIHVYTDPGTYTVSLVVENEGFASSVVKSQVIRVEAGPMPLTETHVFTGFGFSIDYPSGWLAGTAGSITAISELEEDHTRALAEGASPVKGYRVLQDHRGMEYMRSLGLPEEPSLADLLAVNVEFFGWPQPIEASETVVFGVSSLNVRSHNRFGNWVDFLLGFLDDEAFLLVIDAPSEEALDEIMPTWTRMLESIKPVEEIPTAARGVLRLSSSEPPTLDPHLATDTVSGGIIVELFSGLVAFNTDLELVADIAEDWEVRDGTVYIFTLRRDVRFHDGKPVTAHDFKWSFERAADPATGSLMAEIVLGDIVGVKEKLEGSATDVSGVEVIGDHTLQITIDAPKVYFLSKLTSPAAYVLDQENVEAAGWPDQLNGTGPFMLKEFVRSEHIILERNGAYYRGPAKLETVVMNLAGGDSVAMYERDEIHVTSVGPIGRVLDPNDALSKDLVVAPAELGVSYIGFNSNMPPFDDRKFRQALNHAVDKNLIADEVLSGQVEPAYGILPPGLPGYNPDLEGLGFDPELAQRLLAESRLCGSRNSPCYNPDRPGRRWTNRPGSPGGDRVLAATGRRGHSPTAGIWRFLGGPAWKRASGLQGRLGGRLPRPA